MTAAVQMDVWWCARCEREWTVPSRPHNPRCPTCGTGGWFRRFAQGAGPEHQDAGTEAPPATPGLAKRVRCRCKNKDRHFGVCKCHRHKGDTVAQGVML